MKIKVCIIEISFFILLILFPLSSLGHTLLGYVIDTTSDISNDSLWELGRLGFALKDEQAESEDKWFAQFNRMFNVHYRSNTVVRLKGDNISRETITDAKGKFLFEQIPSGDYTLSASAPALFSNTENRVATGYTQIAIPPDPMQPDSFTVKIDAHAITAKGRVVTAEGKPVPNATVAAIQYIHNDIMNGPSARANHISTVTDTNGYYNLSGILPEDIMALAAYLVRGNSPTFWYNIEVRSPDGMIATKQFIPLSEELIYPIGRFLLLWVFLIDKGFDLQYLSEHWPTLPKSEGNVIFVEDIVMERIPESEGEKSSD